MAKWLLRNRNVDIKAMAEKYGISEMMCKIISNRDIKDHEVIQSYIDPSLQYLHSPLEFKDMEKAVEILKNKIKEGKRIRIVGDYDVDGIISTYILYKALSEIGGEIDYEIPDRINDGYGINERIIESAYNDGIDTILTCDNGISAIEPIKRAKELGLTVIVTDHHDIPFREEEDGSRTYIRSEADAIVNPKQKECEYKFKSICGGGVAYKVIEALYVALGYTNNKYEKYIEYVAIATVCDVVDLVDENRIFVKKGLEMLNKSTNVGLIALKKETSLEDKTIVAYHLGFVIGPCLNAAGRLESAKKGLRLLLEEDPVRALELAKEIVELNNERKDMTSEGVETAIEIVESSSIKNDKILVVYIEDVHESLAGIIAGRIKEKYNKPVIMLTKAHNGVKGSARSIEEYNMFEGLIECKDLLGKFGGHPMAAGLSLEESNIECLRKALNENCKLKEDDLQKKLIIDMPLPLNKIDFLLIEELHKLEPFGKGNLKPVFAVKNVKVLKAAILGKDNNVLKLKLAIEGYKTVDAIYFNGVENFEEVVINKYGKDDLDRLYKVGRGNILLDFIFYPTVNEWNGNVTIQLVIDDIR